MNGSKKGSFLFSGLLKNCSIPTWNPNKSRIYSFQGLVTNVLKNPTYFLSLLFGGWSSQVLEVSPFKLTWSKGKGDLNRAQFLLNPFISRNPFPENWMEDPAQRGMSFLSCAHPVFVTLLKSIWFEAIDEELGLCPDTNSCFDTVIVLASPFSGGYFGSSSVFLSHPPRCVTC